MTEKEEMQIFQLISAAGTAKSLYLEAIQKAKCGAFKEAERLITEGDDAYGIGHKIHAEMIAEDAAKMEASAGLILVHAEDQMMSAELVKVLGEEIIDLYKKYGEGKEQ